MTASKTIKIFNEGVVKFFESVALFYKRGCCLTVTTTLIAVTHRENLIEKYTGAT
jgi:hypothetical protein